MSGPLTTATLTTAPLDTDVAIETPEHIVFHYRLAGPARRGLACLIDLVICYGMVIVLAVVVVLSFFGSATSKDISSAAKAGTGLVLLALFAAQWVYFVAFEATSGRTWGKRITGVRVLAEVEPLEQRLGLQRRVALGGDRVQDLGEQIRH